jgi:hypothetical protein
LIKSGLLAVPLVKTIRADWYKMTPGNFCPLQIGQPTKRFQSGLDHGFVWNPLTGH